MNLDLIKNNTKWEEAANSINSNFNKTNLELTKIAASSVKHKGYFTTEAALLAAQPSPKVGDNAYVGATYPGVVYICNTAGMWTATTTVPSPPAVNITEYYKKTETDTLVNGVRADLNKVETDLNEKIYDSIYIISYIGSNDSKDIALAAMITIGTPFDATMTLKSVTYRSQGTRSAEIAEVDGVTKKIISVYTIESSTQEVDISGLNIVIHKGNFVAFRSTGINYSLTGGNFQTYYTVASSVIGTELIPFAYYYCSVDFKISAIQLRTDNHELRILSLENKINIIDGGIYSASGDSISYGYGSTSGNTSWVDYLNVNLGTVLEKKAVNGATVWNNLKDQIMGTSIDAKLITIMIGVNDMNPIINSEYIIGTVTDVINITNDSPTDFANSTLYNHSMLGRLRWCLEWAINNRQSAKIVLITPIHYVNGNQLILDDIRNGEAAIANYLGVKVIRLTDNSLFSPTNFSQYLIDGLHPNDIGYKIIANNVFDII